MTVGNWKTSKPCMLNVMNQRSFDAGEYEFKNTKIKKNHHKNEREVLTWFGQLCLHPQMRENISTILENTENEIEVSKYCDK